MLTILLCILPRRRSISLDHDHELENLSMLFATIWHDPILSNTNIHTSSLPLVIYTSFKIFLDWNNFKHLDLLHFFWHHNTIVWIPYKVELLARHFLLPLCEPSDENSNRRAWLPSFCKCSFLNDVRWALYYMTLFLP